MAISGISTVACEHPDCSEKIDVASSHSMWAVLQKIDATGYSFFQCEEGQVYNDVNYQHFFCCHAHMLACVQGCVIEHYKEEFLHAPDGGGSTILHKIVLTNNLVCKLCQAPLVSVAYRFCLTQGTPQNRVPDESLNHLAEWCCSLDHARQSALAIITAMEAL